MNFNKHYFLTAANELQVSVEEYIKDAKINYVIIEGDEVIKWRGSNNPVIFGSKGDAISELSQWCGREIRNISIITEHELLKTYCEKEIADYFKYETLMDTTNGHYELLVNNINSLWSKAYKENLFGNGRRMRNFEIILKALYERDIIEIMQSERFSVSPYRTSEEVLSDMKKHWVDYAYDYLMGIADNEDITNIDRFVR